MVNEPNKIIIHCSNSPQGRGDGAKEIHKWHLERGWDGIGYNYVIKENGTTEHGRPDYWVPAHVKGYNKHSLGICLIGIDKFTDEQYVSLVALLKNLMTKYDIKKSHIYGHYAFSDKTCPNFNVKEFLATDL